MPADFDNTDRVRRAAALHADAGPVAPESPAWTYLVRRRMCWPPDEPLPGDILRIAAADAKAVVATPHDAAECVVYTYRDSDSKVSAVQLEALTANGQRTTSWPAGRGTRPKRLTLGSIGATAFTVGELDDGGTVGVAEGPTTAMAAFWWLRLPVRASGGATMIGDALFAGAGAVVAVVDRDPAGFARAQKVTAAAMRRRVALRDTVCATHGDCEDDLRRALSSMTDAGAELPDAWASFRAAERVQ